MHLLPEGPVGKLDKPADLLVDEALDVVFVNVHLDPRLLLVELRRPVNHLADDLGRALGQLLQLLASPTEALHQSLGGSLSGLLGDSDSLVVSQIKAVNTRDISGEIGIETPKMSLPHSSQLQSQ